VSRVPTTRTARDGRDVFRVECKKCKKTVCASLYGKQTQEAQLEALDQSNREGDDGSHGVSMAKAVRSGTIMISMVAACSCVSPGRQSDEYYRLTA